MKIGLYFKLLLVSMRSQMQHKASFLMLTAAMFLVTFIDILGIWVLFDRFKLLRGWTLEELAIIYGVVHIGFALSEASARGFDKFDRLVKSGDFDRVLLRPQGTLFQIAASEIQLMRFGRLLQGLLVLLWGAATLQIPFFSLDALIIILSIAGTACIFYALFVLQATFAFWTTESLELMNIATYGGVEAGQYPISVYSQGFRYFFTFVIPLACVSYYPIAAVLHRESLPFWIGFASPLAGVAFLYAACQAWRVGVRRYHSTGN